MATPAVDESPARPALGLSATGRIWNGLLAAVIVVAMAVQLAMAVRGNGDDAAFEAGDPSALTRVIRFFSYFTIQSNLLVLVTCVWIALDPTGRRGLWRVLRLDALVGISVTGLIYVTLLRPLVDLHGVAKLTDIAFHYVAPLAAVIGWVLFGPRGRITEGVLGWSLLWPALYIGYTLAHGAAGDWYPYPFIDVTQLGYSVAIRNGVGVALLVLAVGVLFRWADRALARTRR